MNTPSLVLVPKQSCYRRSPRNDAYRFWAWLDEFGLVRFFEPGDDPNQFPAHSLTALPGPVGGERAGGADALRHVENSQVAPTHSGLCASCFGQFSDFCPSSCLLLGGRHGG